MKTLLALMIVLVPALASAQVLFRMPVSDCSDCAHAGVYPTAYKDLDPNTGTFEDWNCGQLTYDGHEGTDIAIGGWANMDDGSMQVVAGADGTVIYTHDGEPDRCGDGVNGMCGNEPCDGPSGHCGNGDSNSVAIMHSDGKVSTYLHFKIGTVAVNVGDTVTCGQLLGYVGSSGWSTGPHCHFEVDLGGAYLSNPDDPFASTCGSGGPLTYWVDQGAYQDLPGSVCQGESTSTTTTTTTTTTSTTTSTSATSTSGTTGTGTTTSSTTTGSTTTGSTTTGSTTTGSTTTGGQGDVAIVVSQAVRDGTVFNPGVSVTQSWVLLNDGSTRWDAADGYKLVFVSGDALGTPTEIDFAASEATDPGRDKAWGLQIQLPQASASYNQLWQMQHNGTPFGPQLSFSVVVGPATDADGDGHASIATGGDDCDDTDPTVFPGAPEICDGKDNNCNGQIDENLTHDCSDACGHQGQEFCTADANGDYGYWVCQTTETAPEVCNGIDDDCNGRVDDGAPCPSGQTCRAGSCQPIDVSTAGTTTGTTTTGTAGASSGSSGGTTSGDAQATPAGCGCGTGWDGAGALVGLLAFFARKKRT